MFSKKKPERKTPRSGGNNLSQYGLFDIPTNLNYDNSDPEDEDGGDSDLEAELAKLTIGADPPKRPLRKPKPPPVNLDLMIQETLKDIPSDEEISGDDDDPELLNELNEITGGDVEDEVVEEKPVKPAAPVDLRKLLDERLKMYELAEKNAKEAGETGRARRFNRGIKTLKDQIKQVAAGKAISDEDIPPVVTVNIQKRDEVVSNNDVVIEDAAVTPPEPQAEEIPDTKIEPEVVNNKPSIDVNLLKMLQERKNAFKIAALTAKKSGDVTTAVNYVKIVKQFDAVIIAVENGQPVDLSRMPEAPIQENTTVEENETQNEPEEPPQLITASSLAEALEQRLEVYKKQEEAAKEQGNSSKSRRMGRIVKQYEQAIKANKAGKEVALEDLPTPPGHAPLPGLKPPPEEATPPPKPSPPVKIEEKSPEIPTQPRTSGNHMPTTRMEKQLALLKQRQKEFKEAALNAKKKGEINQAKEFLRTAKGFDPLIEAAQGGLPVDISSLPVPPSAKSQLDTEYELVMAQECTEEDSGLMDILTRLESQLTKQLKLCLTTRDHHKALGDVSGMNRFEHLALSVTKDLDLVRIARKTNGAAVPIFHYETRDFSVVKSFTDLNDNDLELNIIRGINYNCANPKEIDTYVKFEFPYPQEEPVRDRTVTIKDTNNPEYNANFKINIHRTSRPCLRVFKRHALKFEVFSKGGFFRGDTLMGTVTVKLQPLETQCELHESFDIMDGRKKVGGKLEVQLKLRDPLIGKEVQQLSERWLVIDS